MLKKVWKNTYFKFGMIMGLFVLAFMAALPRIPVVYNSSYLNLNTYIGGYYLNFFNGAYTLDLREYKKGLDLEGGIRITLKANMGDIPDEERDGALESAKEIIERRVNFLGVSEPYIVTSKTGDEYRIIVEIPGVSDVSQAVSLIGETAQLQFKQLKAEYEWDETKFQEYYVNPDAWEDTNVDGSDLAGVDVVFPQGQVGVPATQPSIQLRFKPTGREEFSVLAKNNVGKPVALFLDESQFPLSMPVVNEDLAQGLTTDPIISGNFDAETANALSLQLRAGALPVPVEILEQETVDASLGEGSVDASFSAGIYGMIFLLAFMVILYGRFGIVADLALIMYGTFVLAIFKMIPVVLTLPGITGFLLSLGMAVDANILIFERIREEIKWGTPRSLAVKFGFERAWSSIRDSNISSLLTAAILFYFGTGPVRGFALTLSIGILVSLFSAIVVTRVLIQLLKLDQEQGIFNKIKAFVLNKFSRKKYADS